RTHPALGDQPVEHLAVLALGAGHGGDLGVGLAVGAAGPAQRGKLAVVDAHRPELAGLVDADHPFDQLARIGIAGVARLAGGHGCALMWRATLAVSRIARPPDRMAFQPATATFHIFHAAWSQRTMRADRRYFLSSASLRPAGTRPEQACGPAH